MKAIKYCSYLFFGQQYNAIFYSIKNIIVLHIKNLTSLKLSKITKLQLSYVTHHANVLSKPTYCTYTQNFPFE